MKIFAIVCVCILSVIFVSSFNINALKKQIFFNKINNNDLACDDIDFWKDFVQRVKKEHPEVDDRNFMKLIAQDMLREKDLYIAGSQILNLTQDVDESQTIIYNEFYGTAMDFFLLPTLLDKTIACEVGNNITLAMIPRTEKSFKKTSSWLEMFNGKKLFLKSLSKINLLMEAYKYEILPLGDDKSNCTKLPEIEAMITKLDKMKFKHQYEWTRSCSEDFKNDFKFVSGMCFRAGEPDRNVSIIFEGAGKYKDVYANPETCVQSSPSSVIGLYFVKKLS